ncbi:MAG: class I SAM-dependent methyltransferase [Ilumatobacteraceae bacterium]
MTDTSRPSERATSRNRRPADIDDVRAFWEQHPLWSGESLHPVGSKAFFEEHRGVYLKDCFGGRFDDRFLPPPRAGGQRHAILDLGCGIGFWTAEFAMRGLSGLVAADLTEGALELTAARLQLVGGTAELRCENAEELHFADESFDHVNCQGVIHHTPNPERAVAEIARILRPGGTASISVYYRSPLLRVWGQLGWVGRLVSRMGGGMRGRGRESMLLESDPDELVRLYDGSDNPIGVCFSRRALRTLLEPALQVDEMFLHYFPARALPFPLPRSVAQVLDRRLGLMLYASVHRPANQEPA